MARLAFPSDISREQFELLLPLLNGVRRHTRPRKHDLYDVFCAVLYFLQTGAPWRALPSDFPPWRTVHEYYTQWTMRGPRGHTLLEVALLQVGREVELERLQALLAQRRWPLYAGGSSTRR